MKDLLPRSLAAVSAMFFSLAGFAHGHPGHSAFDPTVLPHGGHLSEHAFLFTILAVTLVGLVSYWAASRKR